MSTAQNALDTADQLAIDYARELAACRDTADLIRLYETRFGASSFDTMNAIAAPYPAAFGRAQGVLTDLLAIIGRQAAELEQLRGA
jgi:hypothetical protein